MCTCKSSCVVIINGTFVVAMQKKGSCATFPLQSFQAVTLSKGATVCLLGSLVVLDEKKKKTCSKKLLFHASSSSPVMTVLGFG